MGLYLDIVHVGPVRTDCILKPEVKTFPVLFVIRRLVLVFFSRGLPTRPLQGAKFPGRARTRSIDLELANCVWSSIMWAYLSESLIRYRTPIKPMCLSP
jgi:hypothetical protein